MVGSQGEELNITYKRELKTIHVSENMLPFTYKGEEIFETQLKQGRTQHAFTRRTARKRT